MVAVRDELRRGNLWVEGSRRYRQLADFFLPEPEWIARRADFFSRARLPAKAEDGGRFLARRLAAAYDRFQSRFPENAKSRLPKTGGGSLRTSPNGGFRKNSRRSRGSPHGWVRTCERFGFRTC